MKDSRAEKILLLQQAIASIEQAPTVESQNWHSRPELVPIRAVAMRYISHQPRTVEEVRARLKKEDYAEADIEDLLQWLIEDKVLNDRAFAHEWVSQRQRRKKTAPALLRQELSAKGISRDYIDEALSLLEAEDIERACESLLIKKAEKITDIPRNQQEYHKYLRRIAGMAIRKGYSGGMVMPMARRILDERLGELS